MSIIYNRRYHRDHESNRTKVLLKLWQKEERLPKIRRLLNATDTDSTAQGWKIFGVQTTPMTQVWLRPCSQQVTKNLHAIIVDILSDDPNTQIHATTHLCTLLSIGDSPPIEQVVQSGVVIRLVTLLASVDSSPQLQLQAAWALTNIASGTSQQTQAVMDAGAVPIFVKLLFSASYDVCEQAVWALGNIAGDSPQCRDYVLGCGALKPLQALLQDRMPLLTMQKATWTLCNFCRGVPRPAMAQTQLALMDLKRLVKLDDEEILTDACWALYYLLEGHRDEYQAVANANVLPRLLELLNYHSHSVIYAALLTVGNLVRHDTDNPITPVSFDEGGGVLAGDVQTKNIINNGGLPFIRNLLTHKHHTVSIKKEACWILSRITAGSTQQIQAVIDANIVSVLVELVESAEFCVRKEALLAIKFVAFGGTAEQIRYLVDQGCIKQVCRLLGFSDPEIVRDCLELIHYIFRSDDPSRYGPMIRSQVRHQLSFLQGHVSNDIRDYAKELLHDLDESCIAAPLDKGASDNEILSVLAPTHKRPCMDRESQLDELEKRFKADEQHFLPLFELIGKAKGNDPVCPPHTIPPALHRIPPPWLRK